MGIGGGAHFNPGQVTLSSEWGCGRCPLDKQQQLWGRERAGLGGGGVPSAGPGKADVPAREAAAAGWAGEASCEATAL